MRIKLDIKLQEKISKNKYDKREIILLLNTVKTLNKSISGQVLRIIVKNERVFKIMEKRATRAYRVYFVLVIYENFTIILDIVKKELQNEYIKKLEKNIEDIFKRNF